MIKLYQAIRVSILIILALNISIITYHEFFVKEERLECHKLGLNDPREYYIGNATEHFDLSTIQQSIGLQITYPNGGEMLSGVVRILWTLDVLGENPTYNVYYSPDDGVHWIQLAFSIFESSYEWDTLLYETYGTGFLIKVVASSKSWYDKIDISDNTFTIDNRTGFSLEDLYLPFLGFFFIVISSGLAYLVYNKRLKEVPFVDFFESKKINFLKSIREKVVIGLDNIKFEFIEESQDLPYLEAPTSVTSMVEYFPTDIRNELRIEIKGRTVLTLIEIAYQDPSETNPVKLAKSLNIPVSTLSKEIKKLVELEYVESVISSQVIQDGRFRNFKITSKGFSFLSILNNALRMTINRLKEKQNEFNEYLIN
ncbi:MAG: hypothetical protein ACFFAJ_03505 [Candidatus Hodarchaeota archaeon]